jgi:hypothetical protein
MNTANSTIAGLLLNDSHKYLIQKYFDNERKTTLITIGPQDLTLSTTLVSGATSATLTSPWLYRSCQQLVVFSDGEQRNVNFIQNSATIFWDNGGPLSTAFQGNVISASSVTNLVTYTLNTNLTTGGSVETMLANGSGIFFTGASLPGGITPGVTYYIGNVTSTTFELYNDAGLTSPVTISSTGTGPFSGIISTAISTVGVGTYPLPANISKVKTSTINVGQLVYTAAPVNSIQEWTQLNALPYTAEIVCYFFIYQGMINFWPIPSNTGDLVTFYCQIRVPDMNIADFTNNSVGGGSLSGLAAGSNKVTGVGTLWNTNGKFQTGTDLIPQNLYLIIDPPEGDGLPYLIESFQSDTSLLLYKPISFQPNTAGTATTYTIGQAPLLYEDFQDMIVYWALKIYYSSIVKDTERFQTYSQIYAEKEEYMKGYLGTKQVNVNLMQNSDQLTLNPNLFYMASLK